MKFKIYVFVISLFSFFYSETFSQSPLYLLEHYYYYNRPESLKIFFGNWQKEIPTIDSSELLLLNDTLREAYSVFSAFYSPLGLVSVGGSEFGDSIYYGIKYAVVQNSVYISFSDKVYYSDSEIELYARNKILENYKSSLKDSLYFNSCLNDLNSNDSSKRALILKSYGPYSIVYDLETILTDSIVDFRPTIKYKTVTPVYLNKKYDKILTRFLGDEYDPLGTYGIMNPATARGDSEKRKNFLEYYIKIYYGHWGGYWQLITYPKAYSIVFDKDLKYAMIYFRTIYQGGEAMMKNENDKWFIISARLTWIE